MRVDLFDFDLPHDRIALRPASPRDSARLLHVDSDGRFADHAVGDLPRLLRAGDALVFNDTRVFPAQLAGLRRREGSAAKITLNLHKRVDGQSWRAFARPAKRLKRGDIIEFEKFSAEITERSEAEITLRFSLAGQELDKAIRSAGTTPLPPYISSQREADECDIRDYQTLYARNEGSVAAPTAGLHFTKELFKALGQRGISLHFVTLHVGAGTFLPVKSEDTNDHVMHAEWGSVSRETTQALNETRKAGGRIIPVGTTVLRLLESSADKSGHVEPFTGETSIFITPDYKFRAADALLTNFHLPRSTLFMLVCAFSGVETMHAAYRHAIESGYRFFSYGDCCLLFPENSA